MFYIVYYFIERVKLKPLNNPLFITVTVWKTPCLIPNLICTSRLVPCLQGLASLMQEARLSALQQGYKRDSTL
jgi:hypothetical protein